MTATLHTTSSSSSTTTGAMLLCASCRHAFPAYALERAAFGDAVATHMTRAQALLRAVVGRDAAEAHTLQQLSLELQELCAAVHEHTRALHTRLDALASTTSNNSNNSSNKHTCGSASRGKRHDASPSSSSLSQRRQRNVDNNNSSTDTMALTSSAVGETRHRGAGRAPSLTTTTAAPPPPPRRVVRFDDANHTAFAGTVPSHLLRHAHAAFDLVSASIYAVLESAAVQARAEVALLWLRPRGLVSTDLIAPFVVGRDVSALCAAAAPPYRVPETSLPCMVSATGVAANLRPRRRACASETTTTRTGEGSSSSHYHSSSNNTCASPSPRSASRSREAASLTVPQLLECDTAAQLLMPVFMRYDAAAATTTTTTTATSGRRVLAVLHFIGSARVPCAFRRRNEEMALHAASFLSHMLSAHHDTMIGEWTNRFYNPTRLQRTSTYSGALDLRADAKCLDDFDDAPVLIYRSDANDDGEGGDEGDDEGDDNGDERNASVANESNSGSRDGGSARKRRQPQQQQQQHSGDNYTRNSNGSSSHARRARRGGSRRDGHEAVKELRHVMTRKAAVWRAATGIRDLHRYATNMEQYWIAAVETTTRLQSTLGERAAAAIREEVARLRQQRDAAAATAATTTTTGGAALVTATTATTATAAATTTATTSSTSAARALAMTARASMRANASPSAAAAPLVVTAAAAAASHVHAPRRLSASSASSLAMSSSSSSSQRGLQLPVVVVQRGSGGSGGSSNKQAAVTARRGSGGGGGGSVTAAGARRGSAASSSSASSLLQPQQVQRRASTRSTRALSGTMGSELDLLPHLTPALAMTSDVPLMRATPVLKPEEVQQLEGAAVKRLQHLGVDAEVFVARED